MIGDFDASVVARIGLADGDACWEWQGAKNDAGYGQIRRSGRTLYVHRLIADAPAGMEACHTCDNPRCVRPSHLFIGTRQDNMRDMAAKGRAVGAKPGVRLTPPDRQARGERAGGAKLTESVVREIRARYAAGETQTALARAFGIRQCTVSAVVLRQRWGHVQ